MADMNLVEKWGKGLVKGFNKKAVTGDMFSAGGDFTGNYTYHDLEIGTVPLSNYDVTKNTVSESRYGVPVDVGNIQYDYQVEEKISFSAILDEIYNQGMLNEYKVGAFMDKEKNEVISPNLDAYRLSKWIQQAGHHVELPTGGLTKENIVDFLMDCHTIMQDAFVPDNLQVTMRREDWKKLKLADEWVGTDGLAKETLPKGTLGKFDGMSVVTAPASAFPGNARLLISHKDSLIAPTKVKNFDTFEKCENNAGSKVNFLMIHDAFVRGHKADGVLAVVDKGSVAVKPVIAASTGKYAITSTTSGAVIKYTTDGSDPRFSKNAKTYSAAIDAAAKTTIKAAAIKEGLYWSDVATFTVA